ncbi:MAG: ABC transporter permease [Pseudomonadota bacterium]
MSHQTEFGLAGGDMGVRRFGPVNWLGLFTLIERETIRFLSVWTQTILAPLVTAGLFLAIFTLAIGAQRGTVMGVPFGTFLAPGLMMMTVIQNAFANTSSSLMISKVQGNIVDTLMPPLSPGELVAGFVLGGVARGVIVALAIILAMVLFLGSSLANPLWVLVFVVIGSAFLAAAGLVAAIVAVKFDHMAAITNFIVTPLAFLSGTFYSAEALPGVMRQFIHLNPVFYFIDGARYGILGVSDSSPWLGLAVSLLSTAALLYATWLLFRSGYRLKS